MEPLMGSIEHDGSPAKINLKNYFNLYPEIRLFIDKAEAQALGDDYSRIYSTTYDVSECSSNIKYKTVMYGNAGSLTCELVHENCQRLFHTGDRIRLYLDGRCWFCGTIFITDYKDSTNMTITAYDFLRYFKSQLVYGKNKLMNEDGTAGMVASDIFMKICQDLKLPFDIYANSSIPVTPQNYQLKSAFNILEFAINQTVVNSDIDNRKYYMYFHETYFPDDENKTMSETEVFKTGGRVVWALRNNLTVDTVIDDNMIYDYNFKESIDEQTYNEIIVYKNQKTYLSKTGKTSKNGKKTGTDYRGLVTDKKLLNEARQKRALYGYLPYYQKAPDGFTLGQMQQVANELQKMYLKPTHSLSLNCYGIIGMRAGYLVPVLIQDIGGTHIGKQVKDEKTGQYILKPVYRTVTECEMVVEHPLKMNLQISCFMGDEDVVG